MQEHKRPHRALRSWSEIHVVPTNYSHLCISEPVGSLAMPPSERLEALYLEYAAERNAARTHEEVISAVHNYYLNIYQVFIDSLPRTI